MNVLLVEDNADKAQDIKCNLKGTALLQDNEIDVVSDRVQARRALCSRYYHLVLLDLIIPQRFGDMPSASVSQDLLADIESENAIKKPGSIIGITADSVAYDNMLASFASRLWFLLRYQRGADGWLRSVCNKIEYLRGEAQAREGGGENNACVDVAIVTALQTPEFSALKALPVEWMVRRVVGDSAEYLSATVDTKRGGLSVVAVSCTQMGMPAAAVSAAKIVGKFRPRYLVMTGICAGYRDLCGLGDVVVCEQTWDSGSGKVQVVDNVRKFLPEPRTLSIDGNLRESLSPYLGAIPLDGAAGLVWDGARPANRPNVLVGPMVSGAAVIASTSEAAAYRSIHRKIVAIDMEAYAVAYASQHCGAPAPRSMIVKAVCDYADDEKNNDYQAYAAFNSTAFVFRLMSDGFFAE